MTEYIETLQHLAEQFGRLQGVGRKSAMRMAFSVLDLDEESAKEFAEAILEAKERIHSCPICGNLTDKDICPICSDETRDRGTICVVADVRALMSVEKVREYRGLYHVLGGVISPMNGMTPDKIGLDALFARINADGAEEVIVATNPTAEGEVTAMYIAKYLKPCGIKVTRLAYGVPMGSDLEYADEMTLGRALEGRQDV